jgi:hypothetical protein
MARQIMPYCISAEQCAKEGRMQYKDLNLKKIQVLADLDFAHYTFGKNQCSCCYGPKDMPARYWKNGKISDKSNENLDYILFKNAYNGSGAVTANNYLAEKANIYIMWNLSQKKLNKVVRLLREQVGREFIVQKPEDDFTCIVLKRRDKMKEPKEHEV